MANKGLYFVSAAAGAVVGVLTTYFTMKKGIDIRVAEEVEQVKQALERHAAKDKKDESDIEKRTETTIPKDLMEKYNTVNKNHVKTTKTMERISPNEFGDEDDYECLTLLYYKDGILAYDNDDIIDNPDELVGEDFYKHFGEFDEGTVYVRNDRTKCYYEICENELYYDAAVKQSRRGGVND